MTAADPARLHQSSRQLEGDGGRVDVEQLLEAARDEIARLAEGGAWVMLSGPVRQDSGTLLWDALIQATDLIRRQDAALTAVRELHYRVPCWQDEDHERWACSTCFDEDEHPEPWPCPTALALASPDTTQDGGA